jgi:arginyl-tRNA synthetase
VGFGVVLGTDKKRLRTRDASGNMITLEALLDEAVARAEAVMRTALADGTLELAEKDIPEVARVVGIGAVKYADLSQNRASDYVFDWDKMISFDGNAGPYMQYAYARTRSIFAKGGVDATSLRGPIALEAAEEAALARQLLRFGEVVHAAAEASLPHFVAEHLYALARAFSAFYTKCPVLKAEGATRASRLALTELTSRQMRIGLSLLGIETVERM